MARVLPPTIASEFSRFQPVWYIIGIIGPENAKDLLTFTIDKATSTSASLESLYSLLPGILITMLVPLVTFPWIKSALNRQFLKRFLRLLILCLPWSTAVFIILLGVATIDLDYRTLTTFGLTMGQIRFLGMMLVCMLATTITASAYVIKAVAGRIWKQYKSFYQPNIIISNRQTADLSLLVPQSEMAPKQTRSGRVYGD